MKSYLLLFSLILAVVPAFAQTGSSLALTTTSVQPVSCTFFLDDERLDRQKGLSANSTGLLRMQVSQAESHKADPSRPVEVMLSLIRKNRPVSGFTTYNLAKLTSGLPLETMFNTTPQPGDRILVEIKNVEPDVITTLPIW